MNKVVFHRILSVLGGGAHSLGISPIKRRVFRSTEFEVSMYLDLEQFIDCKVLLTDSYEPDTVECFTALVKPGMIALDVGANIGVCSLILAKLVGEAGQVHAFEPSKWACERLRRNVELNQMKCIHIVHAAVGREFSAERVIMCPNGYRLDGRDTATKQKVMVYSIDDYCVGRKIGKLDFVKIDTDGWEPDVLMGGRQTLDAFRPFIIFELGPDHMARCGFDPRSPFKILGDIGYDFYHIDLSPLDCDSVFDVIPKDKSINVLASARSVLMS